MTDTIYLVQSGDKGFWCWEYWYHYWSKNYHCNDFCNTVFLGETIKPEFDGVISYTTGNVMWGEGLISFLENVPAKYIIWAKEDYLNTEPTRNKKIEKLQESIAEKLTIDMFGKAKKLTGTEIMLQENIQKCLERLRK